MLDFELGPQEMEQLSSIDFQKRFLSGYQFTGKDWPFKVQYCGTSSPSICSLYRVLTTKASSAAIGSATDPGGAKF